MQPSYAQDLGVGAIEHGVYGSFINALGVCIGVLGAVPCCPVRTMVELSGNGLTYVPRSAPILTRGSSKARSA